MIIQTHSDRERDDILRMLRVINMLRNDSHLNRPIIEDTPWTKTHWANPKYL